MARENQGLQIALIIFVMLTIVLGVTTFIFFRQYQEKDVAHTQLEKAKATSDRDKADVESQNTALKEMIGFNEKGNIGEIKDQFSADMETYAGALEEDKQFYRPVVRYLHDLVNQKNVELADAKIEVQTWMDKYATREASKDAQIKQLTEAATKAGADLAARTATFKDERNRITTEQQAQLKLFAKARKDSTAAMGAVRTKLDNLDKRYIEMVKVNKAKGEKIRAMQNETFETPDGEIRWVNQINRTVWINLGRADALSRQITFSVYPADTTNLTGGGKKASIEVTQILGDHSAEARVIDDNMSDPIMPGDKIHTPLWSPGERKRFALAGFMDIDGDGSTDQHTVRNLITANGGVVDSETNEKTGRRRGKMTVNTRYLVLGDAPNVKRSGDVQVDQSAFIKGYSDMIGEADRLGIQKISLADLLQQMGWKNRAPVKTYGRGANPAHFRAKAPEGVPRVSTGNVSDFRDRRPPTKRRAPGRGGAY